MNLKRKILIFCTPLFLFSISFSAPSFATLQDIADRGEIRCGYHVQDIENNGDKNPEAAFIGLGGLAQDLCRALAISAFQNENFSLQRFSNDLGKKAVMNGEIDILLLNAPSSFDNIDTYDEAVRYITPVFFNPSFFVVKKNSVIKTYKHLENKNICYVSIGDLGFRLQDLTKELPFPLTIKNYSDFHILTQDFANDTCDVIATDYVHYLALVMDPKLMSNAGDTAITQLKPYIMVEPFRPLIKAGDDHFYDFVQWVIWGLIEAEEKNISQSNILKLRYSEDPSIQRLLGNVKGIGVALNLPDRWLYQVIEKVGNYGEIFDRHLGQHSPYKLKRDLNHLWTKDGLHYAIPVR